MQILMNNRGEIKLADFGMARYFGDPPPPNMTQLVVTLWYRAPELLLGTDKYDTAIDMWSLGCIFGELLAKEPLLQGKNEVDELSKVDEHCNPPARFLPLTIKQDLRALRRPHRRELARFQAPPKRQITPPATNATDSRLCDPRQIPFFDHGREPASQLSPFPQSRKPSDSK